MSKGITSDWKSQGKGQAKIVFFLNSFFPMLQNNYEGDTDIIISFYKYSTTRADDTPQSNRKLLTRARSLDNKPPYICQSVTLTARNKQISFAEQ